MTTWPEVVGFGIFMLSLVAIVYFAMKYGFTISSSSDEPPPRRRRVKSPVERLTDDFVKTSSRHDHFIEKLTETVISDIANDIDPRQDKRVDKLVQKLTEAGYKVTIVRSTLRQHPDPNPKPLVTPPPADAKKDQPN